MTVGYLKRGSGPLHVVALHGWFGDEKTFDPMMDAFDLEAYTFAFVAYRGYGLSRKIAGQYSMAEIATDTLAVADELGWKTFNLIGHSMGGMAIQRVLADAPGRVERMIAITPVPAGGVPLDDQTKAFFESATDSLDARRGILNRSSGNRHSPAWIDHMARYSLETSTKEAFAAYFRAWSGSNFVSEIQGKPHPLHVIVGENDPDLSEAVMRGTFLAQYPNADLEVMANAGHYPMNETPVALATSINRFLTK